MCLHPGSSLSVDKTASIASAYVSIVRSGNSGRTKAGFKNGIMTSSTSPTRAVWTVSCSVEAILMPACANKAAPYWSRMAESWLPLII